MAIVTAVETCPGVNPDRASFTAAREAACDELVAARGVQPAGAIDLLGAIGHAVLATLLPPRRLRFSARKVKSSTSRYHYRDDDPDRPAVSTAITNIGVTVYAPAATSRPGRSHRALDPNVPRLTATANRPVPGTRRHRVVQLMTAEPDRRWTGGELAQLLDIPQHNIATQLGEWTRAGFLARPDQGIYILATPHADA
jgi:hypothetical protein